VSKDEDEPKATQAEGVQDQGGPDAHVFPSVEVSLVDSPAVVDDSGMVVRLLNASKGDCAVKGVFFRRALVRTELMENTSTLRAGGVGEDELQKGDREQKIGQKERGANTGE
jgi:hypothetical protein